MATILALFAVVSALTPLLTRWLSLRVFYLIALLSVNVAILNASTTPASWHREHFRCRAR